MQATPDDQQAGRNGDGIYIHGTNKLKDCFWRRQRMSITYGEAIPAEWVQAQPKSREGYQLIAQTVMERIAALRSQVADLK